jgi:hypothetical protein
LVGEVALFREVIGENDARLSCGQKSKTDFRVGSNHDGERAIAFACFPICRQEAAAGWKNEQKQQQASAWERS